MTQHKFDNVKELLGMHGYTGPNQTIHPCLITRIQDAQKGTVEAIVFDGSGTTGSRLIPNLQYDERAENLTEQEILKGQGNPNTWFRVDTVQQSRTAGAGR